MHDDRLHLPIWSPTADDFAACDREGPIADIDHVGMAAISTAYAFASLSVPSPCKEVYGLLSDVTGIHLDPADRGKKWKRSAPFVGRHPIMPADICGELADILEAILPRIRNAALRARVTDVVWSGDSETARLHHAARRRGRSRRSGCVSRSIDADWRTSSRNSASGAFREGLKLGWAEGRNLRVEYRWWEAWSESGPTRPRSWRLSRT
ncbi:DUF7380 domain-containing protein [Bradyrhizobium diazoefficiens]